MTLTIKPQGVDLEKLQKAAKLLRKANVLFGLAKKDSESAKAEIANWLKAERKIELETLEVGTLVSIDKVCLIERAGQKRLDEKKLLFEEPMIHARFKFELPITKFKPLV